MTARVSVEGPILSEHSGAASAAGAPLRLAVNSISLTRFRNHAATSLEIDRPVAVLTGANGSGKTNLLEALSFLSPGRGMRRARLSEIDRVGDSGPWAVSASITGKLGDARVGTGRDAAAEGERRIVRVDGAPARSQSALGDHLTVSWLTPAMDRLFTEGASGRRRFLDRLVYAFDGEHAGRVNGYEHAWRERNRLIKDGRREAAWYAALEETLAETGVAIAAARAALIARLNRICAATRDPFPAAELALDGEIDRWLVGTPALEVEDRLRATLAAARFGPQEAEGPHRSDLAVTHVGKAMPAAQCSTGEQKALLVGIVLAHARLQAIDEHAAPILLLDEVAAHLDDRRRAALFEAVFDLGGQAWLTGTDLSTFAPIADRARLFDVADGKVRPAEVVS
ncbi:DNA replication/repair protein RecF [Thalassobaculum litoreum]|uniref:DNA replication and repair protein RecF n=1 Tax=Thalassobaculum litoreum DSM 18839 TaxID=1123362 RepID=A0A8G2F470_9PROT|nr:DNA replication/repair protein RecF [Thalassobaculum litoreum]SDG09640.1 DNA replication and repair protein RecF [Thalassobaculum litoreum DSM 18839]